ncbi:hypothetical protein RHMOL_Rhmol11G0098800 [Rhododendron molle]|uniref:Uncharacterized protein n=1 Tax=Rhododendron molle TaxID=49168 RepID=A0ACC0LQN8_RHOML|nr:hypothetical protein RHMOL_Rhmol11G0098800 [Rhododendron molle]
MADTNISVKKNIPASNIELLADISQERTRDGDDGNGEVLELKAHDLSVFNLATSDPYIVDCKGDVPLTLGTSKESELNQGQDHLQHQHNAHLLDFLGVQQFDWVPNIRLVNLVDKVKHEEKRSLHEHFSLNNFWKRSKELKHSMFLGYHLVLTRLAKYWKIIHQFFRSEAEWSSLLKFVFEKINLKYKIDADERQCVKLFQATRTRCQVLLKKMRLM